LKIKLGNWLYGWLKPIIVAHVMRSSELMQMVDLHVNARLEQLMDSERIVTRPREAERPRRMPERFDYDHRQ